MQDTREIYWNIGQSGILPMYLMAGVALAVCVWGFVRLLAITGLGKEVSRSDQKSKRLWHMISHGMGQIKVRGMRWPGIVHSQFFWGFFVLLVGTGLIFLQADILEPLFGITFLTGGFYRFFSLALDLGGLVATVMLLGFLLRRYVIRPKGLIGKPGDLPLLLLLLVILVTGFVIEGLRMAVTELPANRELAAYSPVGYLVAEHFNYMGEYQLRQLHKGFWWLHMALVMGFIAMIPFCRLKHLLLIPVNLYLTNLEPKGRLVTLDLEDESQESFGAAKVSDLTCKDIFDSEACVSCKRCMELCPAQATGKALNPMQLIADINDQARLDPEGNLIERIGTDSLFACTTCHACQTNCPAEVEHVPKIIEMRRNLALMEGQFPGDEVATAMDAMEVNFNPLGQAFAARADWTEELKAEGLELVEAKEAEVLYFVGCYASFDARNQKVAKNLVRLCNAAGIKLGILGKDEKCCGEPARKMGNEYLYQTLAMENISAIQESGAQKVITTCPHCMDTLKNQYPDLGLQVEVEHYVPFLDKLVESGELLLDYRPMSATYHDSCQLGRYNGEYESPRHLLFHAGAKITEMELNQEKAFCCGAGGGRILAEESEGTRINQARIEQAKMTGEDTLISNCPFCLTMFEDGIKGAELEGKFTARDLSEILVERLKS